MNDLLLIAGAFGLALLLTPSPTSSSSTSGGNCIATDDGVVCTPNVSGQSNIFNANSATVGG